MRNFLARFTIALLLSQSLLQISTVGQEGVRPRRSQTERETPDKTTASSNAEWKAPDNNRIVSTVQPQSSNPEPTIRVALATDTRAATISSSGPLMNATDLANTFVALTVPRVRLEARLLSPMAAESLEPTYRVQVSGLASREEAEQRAKEVREATSEKTLASQDTETKTWGLLVGDRHSREEAEELRSRLEDAGFAASIISTSGANNEPQPTTQAGSGPTASFHLSNWSNGSSGLALKFTFARSRGLLGRQQSSIQLQRTGHLCQRRRQGSRTLQ